MDKVNHEDFAKANATELQALLSELSERLLSVNNSHLLRLVKSYLDDASLMDKLKRAPAGIKTHHAYEGGLLRHVVDLLRIADVIAPLYPQLDGEILRVGVFLHDLGKVDELGYEAELSYTDSGQLLGHLVQGAMELETRAQRLAQETGEALPQDLLWRLQHVIISHHGQLDHGSPKVPMTLEAIVLAHLDNLDAKVNAAIEVIEADRNSDSDWTAFHPVLGRKLYKPSAKPT